MERLVLLFFLVLFCMDFRVISGEFQCKEKPNIIVIIADDMGFNDVGFHGSNQISTPNIDALAYNGIILNRHYSQQTCTPSRAAFLTGNYPIRTGLQGDPIKAGENRSLPNDVVTLPKTLRNLGYHTHLVGKWHLGAAHPNDTPTSPKGGFDTHYGYRNGFVGYFNYRAETTLSMKPSPKGFDLYDGLKIVDRDRVIGKYATKHFANKAVEIISNHDTRDPLFLVLSHLAPHTGNDGNELGVPNVTEMNRRFPYIDNENRRKYAEVVRLMDESVGDVIEILNQKAMLNNSIILFLADNGAQTEGLYANSGSNWPLRGLKFTLLEGGIRTAAAIYSPLFEKRSYVNTELIHITDWYPTFVHLASCGSTENTKSVIDGVNQWETLTNNKKTKRVEILANIDEVEKYSGLISGKYKLLNRTFQNGIYDHFFGESGLESEVYNISNLISSKAYQVISKIDSNNKNDDEFLDKVVTLRRNATVKFTNRTDSFKYCNSICLYDLDNDPIEVNDVSERYPDIVERLSKRLQYFYTQLVPQTNRDYDPNADPILHNCTWVPWLDPEYLQDGPSD